MQKYLLSLLAFLARRIIAIHKPRVIGITGTVGKTTITGHITSLLRSHYGEKKVGASAYHYNGEYGLPLTIISAKTGGKNPFRWIWVILVAVYRMIRPYPSIIVLEYGIDHPGEMDFLLSVVVPDIAVITPIAPNHLEQFGTLERYREEKFKIARDPHTSVIAHDTLTEFLDRKDALWYGEKENSPLKVLSTIQRTDSLAIELSYEEVKYELMIPAFGVYQALNILPLFAIARKLDIPYECITALSAKLVPESGRSNILEGISGSTIIDGSYNGGYESILEGLKSLIPFLETHRILILLGDMRELGEHAPALHRKIGDFLIEHFASRDFAVTLYLVGALSSEYIYPMVKTEMETVQSLSSRDIGKIMRKKIVSEVTPTLIYVKGSQNTIFLEEAVKEILKNPLESSKLTRQSLDWKKKKDAHFASLSSERI